METRQISKLPPPPGLISSVTAGFDTVANHVLLIIPPLLFDLWLWLGPHLGIERLLKPVIALWVRTAEVGQPPALVVEQMRDTLTQLAEQFNMVASMRTFPIGLSSLLYAEMPLATPFGRAPLIEIGDWGVVMLLTLLLVCLGWLLGGLVYGWTARVVLRHHGRTEFPPLPRAVLQSLLLSFIWMALLVVLAPPLSIGLSLVVLLIPGLGQVLYILVGLAIMWLLIPVYFSGHGIFVFGQNAFQSIRQSFRMVRFSLPTSGMFMLLLIVINQGLGMLWLIPPKTSWLTLVGIAGHALVSMSTLSASFIYYYNLNAWIQAVTDRLRSQTTLKQA